MNIPDSMYLKKVPWWKWIRSTIHFHKWKFWKWFNPRIRIPFKKELTGEAVSPYRISNGFQIQLVYRKKSDQILCKCGGEFKATGKFDRDEYYLNLPEIYICNKCKGTITVGKCEIISDSKNQTSIKITDIQTIQP